MALFSKKPKPDKIAEKFFGVIIECAVESNNTFERNISKDYHATLFVTFFMIYGIDLVNIFILNKYGSANRDISTKLFSLITERINSSFAEEEAEMIMESVSAMEDEIFEALKQPLDGDLNNSLYILANFITSIIDIRDDYDELQANQLLVNCLAETLTEIDGLVEKSSL